MAEEIKYKQRVATITCQYRSLKNGRIVTADAHTIHMAPVGHIHFRDIGENINLKKATEEELMKARIDIEELLTFAYEEYGLTLEFYPEMSQLEKVRKFCDARSREVDVKGHAKMPE